MHQLRPLPPGCPADGPAAPSGCPNAPTNQDPVTIGNVLPTGVLPYRVFAKPTAGLHSPWSPAKRRPPRTGASSSRPIPPSEPPAVEPLVAGSDWWPCRPASGQLQVRWLFHHESMAIVPRLGLGGVLAPPWRWAGSALYLLGVCCFNPPRPLAAPPAPVPAPPGQRR